MANQQQQSAQHDPRLREDKILPQVGCELAEARFHHGRLHQHRTWQVLLADGQQEQREGNQQCPNQQTGNQRPEDVALQHKEEQCRTGNSQALVTDQRGNHNRQPGSRGNNALPRKTDQPGDHLQHHQQLQHMLHTEEIQPHQIAGQDEKQQEEESHPARERKTAGSTVGLAEHPIEQQQATQREQQVQAEQHQIGMGKGNQRHQQEGPKYRGGWRGELLQVDAVVTPQDVLRQRKVDIGVIQRIGEATTVHKENGDQLRRSKA
jgi:hypothetical protein